MEKKHFFKLVGEKVDVFGKNILVDENFGTLNDVGGCITENMDKDVKWELYVFDI